MLTALLAAWSTSPAGLSSWQIERKLERAGYTDTQIAMGISRLMSLSYVEQSTEEDRDGDNFHAYRITPAGIRWLHDNEQAIEPLEPKSVAARPVATGSVASFLDDDIPF